MNYLFIIVIRSIAQVLFCKEWQLVRSCIYSEQLKLMRQPSLKPHVFAHRLLISGEDHRHMRHPGFDLYAICRAIWRRLTLRSKEGASTIEQQIVRIITNSYENTINRKIREIMLASLVAKYFPKTILPSIYLIIGYYGWQMNGYSQACKRLDVQPKNMTLEIAAGLVARLKYPEPKVTPHKRLLQIRRRKNHLLKLYKKHLTDGTYEHEYSETIRSRFSAERFVRSLS